MEDDISTETDRVRFLKSVAAVFLSKARIKLNLKRLYAADVCVFQIPRASPRASRLRWFPYDRVGVVNAVP